MLPELQRPLVVLDLESTGLNPRYDRIVEVAALKLHPDGRRERFHRRVNPQRPMPPAAASVHGLTDAVLAKEPPFVSVAGELIGFLRGADLAGFGIAQFDLPLLRAEFARVGVTLAETDLRVVDAKVIYHRKEPRTLAAALRFYCNEEHADAHSAEADVRATLSVIEGQLARYPDLPRSVSELDRYCQPDREGAVDREGRLKWSAGEVVVNFGQKSGVLLRELAEREPKYLQWMLNRDFSPEVKAIVRDALNGKFPEPRAPEV